MDKFIGELKQNKVINKQDIEVLKNYIYQKYIDKNSYEKSQILSNTIHKILDENLDGLPEKYKPIIKVNILKSTILKNKSLVSLYDIFNACISEQELVTNFSKNFTEWINSRVENKTDETKLKNYVSSTNSDLRKLLTNNVSKEGKSFNFKQLINKPSSTLFHLNKKTALMLTTILILISFYPLTKAIGITSTSYIGCFIQKERFNIKNLDEIFKFGEKDSCNSYPNSHLPTYMHYKKINDKKLKDFLIKKKSLLSEEPYFSSIIYTSKQFNLNPLVLFAITGQEQSFVPANSNSANKIANNPFNVYHSWKEYNTDIDDSSKIAARTVINLSKDMPQNTNPFLWIGKDYAEDNSWGKGVEEIFKELNEYTKE